MLALGWWFQSRSELDLLHVFLATFQSLNANHRTYEAQLSPKNNNKTKAKDFSHSGRSYHCISLLGMPERISRPIVAEQLDFPWCTAAGLYSSVSARSWAYWWGPLRLSCCLACPKRLKTSVSVSVRVIWNWKFCSFRWQAAHEGGEHDLRWSHQRPRQPTNSTIISSNLLWNLWVERLNQRRSQQSHTSAQPSSLAPLPSPQHVAAERHRCWNKFCSQGTAGVNWVTAQWTP